MLLKVPEHKLLRSVLSLRLSMTAQWAHGRHPQRCRRARRNSPSRTLSEAKNHAEVGLPLFRMAGNANHLRPKKGIEKDFILRRRARRRPSCFGPQTNMPAEEVFGPQPEVIREPISERKFSASLEMRESEPADDKRLQAFLRRFEGKEKSPLIHVDVCAR